MVVARLVVGRIARAHGLRGEVVIAPISNIASRFTIGAVLRDGDIARTIVSSRVQADRFVVRFDGIEDRNAAEALRGHELLADAIESDDPDEFFVHELIGSRMVDQHGRDLGVIAHVEANPAHDIAVCDSGVLVPIVFIRDSAKGVVTADLPDGLVELYLDN